MSTRTELDVLVAQIEEMWAHQDTLFTIVEETNQWDHAHGADWVFADVPYHLYYCNIDLVLRPMKFGRELPAQERESFVEMTDLGAWNDRKLAERPAGQTPAQSVAELHSIWQQIRDVLAGLDDADLERPHWLPFFGGNWATVREGLHFLLGHDWSEFMQLRIHMGESQPVPSPEITAFYLYRMFAGLYPMFFDKEAAAGRTFKADMVFTDPGISDIVIDIKDNAVTVTTGPTEAADLVITQSAETFEKVFRGILPYPEAMQSGAVQVNDMDALATLGALFPMDKG